MTPFSFSPEIRRAATLPLLTLLALLFLSACTTNAVPPTKSPLISPDSYPLPIPRPLPIALSMQVQNADLPTLLREVAKSANISLVMAPEVNGLISIEISDASPSEALAALAAQAGLQFRQHGSIAWVHPALILDEIETVQIPLRYQRVENLKTTLGLDSSGRSGLLSKSGLAFLDTRTNQIILTDTRERIATLLQIVDWIDVPTRQVEIDVQIVEADQNFSRNIGARLNYANRKGFGVGSETLTFGGSSAGIAAQSGFTSGDAYTGSSISSLPAAPINGITPATFATSLFSAGAGRYLNIELSALEANGSGRVLSRPRVITADQTLAIVEQGTELPYQVVNATGTATSISFRKANLKLEVLPQITPRGAIILSVDVSKDSVGVETRSGFAVDTKHIKTQVAVEDGGIVMLGGIATESEIDSETKVPVLGDIPFLGNLFKSRGKKKIQGELLIFITPRVLPLQTSS